MQNEYNKAYPDINSLKISRDGKLFKSYAAGNLPFVPIDINLEKLPYGTYDFEYQNVINQLISKRLIIKSPGNYSILIYPDSTNYIKNLKRTLIDNLEEGSSLSIFYESSGCFHNKVDSLKILRSYGRFYLSHADKQITLTEDQKMLLVKLESDLMELTEDEGCTTSENYRFVSNGSVRRYVDNTCNLNAWGPLIASLR